jgi:hypothetical protein
MLTLYTVMATNNKLVEKSTAHTRRRGVKGLMSVLLFPIKADNKRRGVRSHARRRQRDVFDVFIKEVLGL